MPDGYESITKSREQRVALTGRVYYLAGLFAYQGAREGLKNFIEEERITEIFENEEWSELFRKAFVNYCSIKDIARALPCLIFLLDPIGRADQEAVENQMVWELLKGEYDFLSDRIDLEQRVTEVLEGRRP